MILIDANLLVYAHDTRSPHHAAARPWLEAVLGGTEPVRIPLIALLAFVRIVTNPTLFPAPLSPDAAIEIVTGWLSQPDVAIATPTDRHWQLFREAASGGQARGPLLMDAHIAALAIERGATLMSADRGFTRFPGLRFRNPISG